LNGGIITSLREKKKGKEKVRTWKKLSSKLRGSFCPSTFTPMIESNSIDPTGSFPSTPHKKPTPPMTFPPQIRRCLKCQGFGHLATDCPNKEFITLDEWEVAVEVELEEKIEEKNGDVFEEVVIEADEGEMLAMDTHHPPRRHEHLSLPTTYHEPPTFSPTPPTPKTLNPNFCPSILEPILEAPNSELRAYEEMVLNMFKKSPMCNFQINKGNEHKRVPKFKGDLFSWLILFQPEMKKEEEFFTQYDLRANHF